MAFYLKNQIKPSLIKNFSRLLSGKFTNAPAYSEARAQSAPARNTRNLHRAEDGFLQPATLPKYFDKPSVGRDFVDKVVEDKTLLVNAGEEGERQFESSMTQKLLTVPLKKTRLSNPFPDPVKIITYDTISDEEKVEAKRNSIDSMPIANRPILSMGNRRNFCSVGPDASKCKKMGQGIKRGCPKIILPGCEPPKSIECKRLPHPPCTKQEAPYPSYSESCAEDPEYKPSECRMCPWKPAEHPTYKPPKRRFHSSAAVSLSADGNDRMECDLYKGECPRPKRKPCGQKPKKTKKPEKKKPEKKKCADWLIEEQFTPMLLNKSESPDKGKCKKFRYQQCNVTKKKEETPKGGCKEKKKKPLVKDCPGEEDAKCSSSVPPIMMWLEDKKPKCPKVDLQVLEEDQKPCKIKKPGTQNCPGDLLGKKKKKKREQPKKKTSSDEIYIPLGQPSTSANNPQIRT